MTDRLLGRWRGRAVVCAASGPSITAHDLDLVRQAGVPLICVNNTWQLAPWAEAMVAMDTAWWRHYGAEVASGFGGERIGFTAQAVKFGASYSTWSSMVHNFGNSGAAAIAAAVRGRAARVLLLGYDCLPRADGQMHWHGNHPAPLNNPHESIKNWPRQFARVAKHAADHRVLVLNCSRATALDCFDRITLEEALRTATSSVTSGSSTNAASGTRTPAAPPSGTATCPGP
jgi:hypothetical protein